MNIYETMLQAGGKTNSLGRSSEVIESVRANPSSIEELFGCISADDPWVRMRAIDSFEKIVRDKPEWGQPYIDKIFSELAQSSQPSIQWHLAQIFTEVQLTNKQRGQAIEWLVNKIQTTNIDWIVSVNVMKALRHFYQNGFFAAGDLKRLCKIQEAHTSKSARKKQQSLANLYSMFVRINSLEQSKLLSKLRNKPRRGRAPVTTPRSC